MIETRRLTLRRPRLSDIPDLYSFLGDPAAMALTHTDQSLRECRKRVLVHEWFRRKDGCAPWVIATRQDRKTIGWGGLYQDPFDTGWGYEVGYYFARDAWGFGYASELVASALMVADDHLALPKVWAMAHPENLGSRRVLEKAGFETVRFLDDRNRYLFCRSKP